MKTKSKNKQDSRLGAALGNTIKPKVMRKLTFPAPITNHVH
jgi:hypothetical protein